MEKQEKIHGCASKKAPSVIYVLPEKKVFTPEGVIPLCSKKNENCSYFGERFYDSGLCLVAIGIESAKKCLEERDYGKTNDYFVLNTKTGKHAVIPACMIGKYCSEAMNVFNKYVCKKQVQEASYNLEEVLERIGVRGNPDDFVIEPLMNTVYMKEYLPDTANNKKASQKPPIQ